MLVAGLVRVRPGLVRWAGAGVVLAVAAQLVMAPSGIVCRLLPGPPEYFREQASFTGLARWLGPQERVHVINDDSVNSDFSLLSKSPSLFRIPGVFDYEPLASRRYAEYWTMLSFGGPLKTANQLIYANPRLTAFSKRRLLDLAAVRFVVAVPGEAASITSLRPPLRVWPNPGGLRAFENRQALPRALWVPRIEVVPAAEVLERLATGSDDLRTVALVEEPPASGFVGARRPAGGVVQFVRNQPEHVVLQVTAPERGFVLLADQHFPGWSATVNARREPILRANHLFRLLEVPAGVSTVEFRYRPTTLLVGAAISLASVLAACVAVIRVRRRRRAAAPVHVHAPGVGT